MTDTERFLQKLQCVEHRISMERGPFALFAIFRIEVSPQGWDLVISAPWADDALKLKTLRYVDRELKKDLALDDMVRISRIIIIPTDFEDLQELYEEHPVEHGKVIVRNREFGLQMVQKGYIITCRTPVAKAA